MTDNDIPVREPEYLLERIDDDYRLRKRGGDTAIYINDTAALLWELCDGRRRAGAIKELLKEAYPDAGDSIGGDVDEALAMLAGHAALAVKPGR